MAADKYEYEVGQCDVTDQALLIEFRKKRSEWLEWLDGDRYHSIMRQIGSMMWDDAVYRSLNEARQFASEANPTAAINGMLSTFLDRSYLSGQILAICKITDKSHKNPKRGVISLRRLFEDIKQHRHLLTRENFVAYDGVPYDHAAAYQKYIDGLSLEELREPRWLPGKGADAWVASMGLHSVFDAISGVSEVDRDRTDLVADAVFNSVEAWFEAPILQKVRTHRNTFVGHAADEVSRTAQPLDRLGFSLNEIAEAQRIVVRIATAIGTQLLYGPSFADLVPVPQFNVVENLEMPLIPEANIKDMSNWWDAHVNDRDDWLHERVDLISGKIEAPS